MSASRTFDQLSTASARAVEIYSDSETLMRAAADRLAMLAGQAVSARGRFAIALSGGSTPRPLYQLLAGPPWASRLEWSRIHVFWGDERCVPPDHADSNYRMARAALLDHVAIPAAHIHRIAGESEPDDAARAYEQVLRAFFLCPEGPPRRSFDVALLGMGDDGHTASLFPGTAPLAEQRRWVMPNYLAGASSPWRITLTPIVFNAVRDVVFLVSGESKAARLAEALESEENTLPVQRIRPATGAVTWMVDEAAASQLRRRS